MNYHGQDQALSNSPQVLRLLTLRERLDEKKKWHEQGLSDANKALEILNANPQLEEFHEAVQRAGF